MELPKYRFLNLLVLTKDFEIGKFKTSFLTEKLFITLLLKDISGIKRFLKLETFIQML